MLLVLLLLIGTALVADTLPSEAIGHVQLCPLYVAASRGTMSYWEYGRLRLILAHEHDFHSSGLTLDFGHFETH